jgi:hypothetical protein
VRDGQLHNSKCACAWRGCFCNQAAVQKDLQPFWRLRQASVQMSAAVPISDPVAHATAPASRETADSMQSAWDKYWDDFVTVPAVIVPVVDASAHSPEDTPLVRLKHFPEYVQCRVACPGVPCRNQNRHWNVTCWNDILVDR